jgi:hypothetical protein
MREFGVLVYSAQGLLVGLHKPAVFEIGSTNTRLGPLTTLQRHNTEALKEIFPEKELATVPISSPCVCERFIFSQDRSAILLPENMWTDPGNI